MSYHNFCSSLLLLGLIPYTELIPTIIVYLLPKDHYIHFKYDI
jgi:hypothetical protein